jgi:hypothetical protein
MSKKPFRVTDPYRKNDLSLVPGGSVVVVEYRDGSILEYDKIKNTDIYITQISGKPEVLKAYVK